MSEITIQKQALSLILKYADMVKISPNKISAIDTAGIILLEYSHGVGDVKPFVIEANELKKVLKGVQGKSTITIVPSDENVKLIIEHGRAKKIAFVPKLSVETEFEVKEDILPKDGALIEVTGIKPGKEKDAYIVVNVLDDNVEIIVRSATGELVGEQKYVYEVLEKYGGNVVDALYPAVFAELVAEASKISKEIKIFAGKDKYGVIEPAESDLKIIVVPAVV